MEAARVVAVDDCGIRINPMIVDGQIHGGLTEGYAIAAMQLITFDDDGNCIGSNFMDYLMPTAWETPKFETYETVTPSPHHPIGAKGVGESPDRGLARRLRQRGDRCGPAPRRDQHRDADDLRARVGGHPGGPRAVPSSSDLPATSRA